jgi:hypothetical protein
MSSTRIENGPGVGAPRPFVSKLQLAGDWVRQPESLHSGVSQAAISLELWRALRLRLCGIADRLSQHLAQLRLCLCRFPLGWLPLSHTSCVGMLEAQLSPFSSRELAMAQQGGAQVVGNIGMYYAAYRLSQQCWNVMPTGRNARGVSRLAMSSRFDGCSLRV